MLRVPGLPWATHQYRTVGDHTWSRIRSLVQFPQENVPVMQASVAVPVPPVPGEPLCRAWALRQYSVALKDGALEQESRGY